MKKFLPKTSNNTYGFTLIELLVVTAIIAILAVVGVALFTQTQSKARDSKRIQDIIAMAKAMETKYRPGVGYETVVSSTWFADQQTPQNPGGGSVTSAYTTTINGTSSFTFCALLENSVGNATTDVGGNLGTTGGNYFCKVNNQ